MERRIVHVSKRGGVARMTISGFPELASTVPNAGTAHVNPVTGMLELEALDYGQLDIGETFLLKRIYTPRRAIDGLKDRPMLGKRWQVSFSGKLVREGARIWLSKENMQWDTFVLREGRWVNGRGDGRFQLQEKRDGFVLKDSRTPEECVYNAKGYLVSVQSRGGLCRLCHYYGDTPTRVVLSSGQELQLSFVDDMLVSVEDSLKRKILYQYEGRLLRKVTYPNHSSIRYDYDDMNRLVRCIDRSGKEMFFNSYDDYNRVVRQKMGTGAVYSIRYRDQDRQTIVMDESTREYRVYYWNQRNQIDQIVYEDGEEERIGYDTAGRVVYKQDRAQQDWRWVYDDRGLVTREIRPGDWVIDYEYDSLGRLVRKLDNFDGEERYVYNGNGWLIRKSTRLTGKLWREETWERDMLGRILVYSRNGNRTSYAYGENAPLPHLMETACGYKFNYHYDKVFRLQVIRSSVGEHLFGYNALDLVAREEDALKHQWVYEYNLQGEVQGDKKAPVYRFPGRDTKKNVTETDVSVYKEQEGVYFQRDPRGRLMEIRDKTGAKLLAMFQYDIGGRRIEERIAVDGASQGRAMFRLTRWKYDENDNVMEKRMWLDPQDKTSTRGRIHIQRFTYDAQDRLIHVEDNKGEEREYVYDLLGCCVMSKWRRKEQPVQVTKYVYDAVGRLVARDEKSDYAQTGRLWDRTAFTLDEEGRCRLAVLSDGTEWTGDKAEEIYEECQRGLPRYKDLSGYSH